MLGPRAGQAATTQSASTSRSRRHDRSRASSGRARSSTSTGRGVGGYLAARGSTKPVAPRVPVWCGGMLETHWPSRQKRPAAMDGFTLPGASGVGPLLHRDIVTAPIGSSRPRRRPRRGRFGVELDRSSSTGERVAGTPARREDLTQRTRGEMPHPSCTRMDDRAHAIRSATRSDHQDERSVKMNGRHGRPFGEGAVGRTSTRRRRRGMERGSWTTRRHATTEYDTAKILFSPGPGRRCRPSCPAR